MQIKHGEGSTKYGPGVSIELTGEEVATAIDAYLAAHRIHVSGARTITVNGELCSNGRVYVDPSGFVIDHNTGEKLSGRRKGYSNEYAGHCVEGENHCVCGGDLPRVREGCHNWRKA